MSQTKNTPDNTVYLSEADPNGDYITIAAYIRRRQAQDLLKDPLTNPLYHTALLTPIKRGDIEVLKQGKTKFIDWNKYGNFLFKRNFSITKKIHF